MITFEPCIIWKTKKWNSYLLQGRMWKGFVKPFYSSFNLPKKVSTSDLWNHIIINLLKISKYVSRLKSFFTKVSSDLQLYSLTLNFIDIYKVFDQQGVPSKCFNDTLFGFDIVYSNNHLMWHPLKYVNMAKSLMSAKFSWFTCSEFTIL